MLIVSGILQGIVSGIVIAAVAAGMSLIYRVSHITNFLHGSLLALALYSTLALSWRTGVDPLYLTLPMAPLMAAVGLAVYWALIRPARGRHHLLLVQLLLGASFVVDSLLLMTFGADLQSISNGLSARFVTILGTGFGLHELASCLIAAVGLSALTGALHFSEWGRRFRAVASDELAARLAGVSVEGIEAATWATSIGLLGLIAPAMGAVVTLTPDMGLRYTVLALCTMIIGGMGSLFGAIWAGMLVGIAQAIGLLFLPGSYGALLPYVLLVIVLIFRPGGFASLVGRH